jgi:cytochrome c-type biogenesis protein
MVDVTVLAAFLAGIISFVSPCVLPIVPGYLSFITGLSLDEMQGSGERRRMLKGVVANMLAFIAGFSVVFISLGATATFVGRLVFDYKEFLARNLAVLVIIFGLHFMRVVDIPFLNYEKRFHSQSRRLGVLGSFLIGLTFAFGWTPCIGPILASILFVAGSKESISQGIFLLTVYSLGLGIPFFLAGIAFNLFVGVSSKIKRHFKAVEITGGVLLLVVGFLLLNNYLEIISGTLMQYFPWLNLG